jgi:murein DD-endopeptidase MepM/ murein hydrolase activator NlpD
MAVAGGAVAATAHHVLAEALPQAADGVADGVDLVSRGVGELFGAPAVAPAVVETASASTAFTPTASTSTESAVVPALDVVTPEPVVADAAELVKAADLQRAAAEAEAARAAEQARAAAEAPRAPEVVEQVKETVASVGGAVEMITGRVTSGFGSRWGTLHQGLDIAAPIGTPIHAPLAGTVIDSGPASGFGLWVRLRHADGTVTVYGHINRSLVKVGDKVAAGEVIAEVGNRGQSTGPHLHIEVITPDGKKINPRPWLDDQGIQY